MNLLHEAAQQALEALEEACEIVGAAWTWRDEKGRPSIDALRAALAQEQAEPVQEPVQKPVAVVRSVVGQGDEGVRIKWLGGFPQIGDRLYTAPPKAEPAQTPVAWVASTDGRVIYNDASTDDGLLRISGDFETDEQRIRYTQQIVDALNAVLSKAEPAQEPYAWHYTNNAGTSVWHRRPSNRLDADMQAARDYPHAHKVTPLYTAPPKAEPVQEPVAWMSDSDVGFDKSEFGATPTVPLYTAPPQRTMVPLTAQQLDGVIERHVGGSEITDDVYASMEQFARAIEKAIWEKNHGQA